MLRHTAQHGLTDSFRDGCDDTCCDGCDDTMVLASLPTSLTPTGRFVWFFCSARISLAVRFRPFGAFFLSFFSCRRSALVFFFFLGGLE